MNPPLNAIAPPRPIQPAPIILFVKLNTASATDEPRELRSEPMFNSSLELSIAISVVEVASGIDMIAQGPRPWVMF